MNKENCDKMRNYCERNKEQRCREEPGQTDFSIYSPHVTQQMGKKDLGQGGDQEPNDRSDRIRVPWLRWEQRCQQVS